MTWKPICACLLLLVSSSWGLAEPYAWQPFEPVRRPAVPTPKNLAWAEHPVDAFLAQEHEAKQLKPRPAASRTTLLRRIYLDLVGIPPTPAEVETFLADSSPEAYTKVVDKLLASPLYGQRWGRHWLDVWRYSDWAGYGQEVRDSQKHIWHWRDWVVESLNADKGYDRMVQEMLAADELAPTDEANLRATGYLARNWSRFSRNGWLQNTVEHTGKAFLGLTLNCARCHDHFYDPLTQAEHYQFRAFFEPHQVRTDRLPGQPDVNVDGLPRVYDADLQAPTYLFQRGDDSKPEKSKPLAPAVPAMLKGSSLQVAVINLPTAAYAPEKRPALIADLLAQSEAERAKAYSLLSGPFGWLEAVPAAEAKHQALVATLRAEQLEDAGQKETPAWQLAAKQALRTQRLSAYWQAVSAQRQAELAAAKADAKTKAASTKKLDDANKALAKADADLQAPVTTAYTKRALTTYPVTSTGRRLALARWLTDRQNPLAARVAVNHIWLRHFGKPLVNTVFDFGKNGAAPSHPELLDWLAVELMEQRWSMKHLHRLLVTSQAYQLDSVSDAHNASLDPDNRLVWHMNARRLEAEAVRDSVLSVAGNLDTTLGGPDIPYAQGLSSRRRSLYFQHAHEKQMEFLKVFDGPNVVECYQRSESIIPQQALALANSSLSLHQARLLARALHKTVGESAQPESTTRFIQQAFLHVLSRQPTAEEASTCASFLVEQAALLNDVKKLTPIGAGVVAIPAATQPHLRARESLVQVLLNHHEFVTIR